jgi:hypothetical protein
MAVIIIHTFIFFFALPFTHRHIFRHTHTHIHAQPPQTPRHTDTHTHSLSQLHPDLMSSTVVKMQIDRCHGEAPADYTGTVNSDGVPHGRGSYEVVAGKWKGDAFDGTFVDGECDGVGKYKWSTGRYVGEYYDGGLNGFGRVFVLCLCVSHFNCLRRHEMMVSYMKESGRITAGMDLERCVFVCRCVWGFLCVFVELCLNMCSDFFSKPIVTGALNEVVGCMRNRSVPMCT